MGGRISVFLLSAASLVAGNIYGTLRENGRAVAGVRVEIGHLQARAPYSAQTGQDGSYRLFVQERGRCIFRVFRGQDPAVIEVFSYDEPVKYDFDLVFEGGKYSLQRR